MSLCMKESASGKPAVRSSMSTRMTLNELSNASGPMGKENKIISPQQFLYRLSCHLCIDEI